MTFLVYRGWGRPQRARAAGAPDNPNVLDWLLAVVAVVPFAYIVADWDAFFRRAVVPTELDVVMGTLAILLTLEAARRTVGWIMPLVVVAFLGYAAFGPYVPGPFATASYDWERLVGHNVMGLQGLFGVPTDVAATYIILFTIYGAVLTYSGATRFFIDLSLAAFGQSAAGPGRTVALAGFLLGTVSGSGVATTVTLGGVTWPLLRRAGYPQEQGGGVLAAAGIGAILSPPTLGAAAFIIAELLNVSYLQVLVWATIPTLLYYLGIILAVEMDARRYRTHAIELDVRPAGALLLRYGYHFSSLVAIVVFMAMGLTPFRAVVYATGLAFVLSFLDRSSWMTPRRIVEALAAGATGALSVIPVMAAAGIIVGVMTLTGLGLKLANIIVDDRGRQPRAHRGVLRDRGDPARPGRPGHRELHHLLGDHRACPAGRRRSRLRRRDVRLLLLRAERGLAAHRAVAVRSGGHHRRQAGADDVADVEVHAAGVPRPVRRRALATGRRAAHERRRRHRRHRDADRRRGGGRAGRRHGRLAPRAGRMARTRPVRGRRRRAAGDGARSRSGSVCSRFWPASGCT